MYFLLFSLVWSANMEEAGCMNHTAASHQGVIKMIFASLLGRNIYNLWYTASPMWPLVMLSIYRTDMSHIKPLLEHLQFLFKPPDR